MNNITLKKTMKVATIAGASILVVNSAMKLMNIDSPKGAIMPLVSILVGIAAFNYAMSSSAVVVSEKK